MSFINKVKDFFKKGDDPMERYEMDEEKRNKARDSETAGGTFLSISNTAEVDRKRREKDKKNDKQEIKKYIEETSKRISR